MSLFRRLAAGGAVAALCPALVLGGVPGASVAAAPQPDAPATARPPAANYFTDTVLVNQNGEPLRFYSDLLQGRVVIINPFFTSCKGVCPMTMARLKKVQEWLESRRDPDVMILSLTVDPATDTPEKLQAYAQQLGMEPGWQLLSGTPENVDFILKKLGQYVDEPDAHTNLLIVGNEATGLWKKAFALAGWEDLIAVIASVIDDGS
jgi:protein SCO1/2